jgi:hypothetical protein
MNSLRLFFPATILVSLWVGVSALQAGAPASAPNGADSLADKSIYNFFNPTPDNLLRDFAPDRPGFTNGPRTIDAGHFQIETGLFEYGRDTHNPDFTNTRNETFTWGDTELRIGMANWIELDLAIPFYTEQRVKDLSLGHTERTSGIGDLVVGAKINFWGNDAKETTAGGLNLELKTPTASHGLGNGKVEPAALFLFDMPLPGGFDLEMNHGVAVNANDSGHGYHADLINSISISHSIAGPLSAFAEFYTTFDPSHTGQWIGTTDFGLIWQVNNSLQFDVGMNIGVSRAADDLGTFFGVSYRF